MFWPVVHCSDCKSLILAPWMSCPDCPTCKAMQEQVVLKCRDIMRNMVHKRPTPRRKLAACCGAIARKRWIVKDR